MALFQRLICSGLKGDAYWALNSYRPVSDALQLSSKDSARDNLDASRGDIFEDTDKEDWNQAYLKAHKQTINTLFNLPQYKCLMRTFITPVRLHHMSSDI